MSDWIEVLQQVEMLEDLDLDHSLVTSMQEKWENNSLLPAQAPLRFHTPGFKSFQSSEIKSCDVEAWPAVSITGSRCKLQCDHCKAKILEPMLPAETPQALWQLVNMLVEKGGKGMLLTGGSNHRNEVEYGKYYSTIRRIKDSFPFFQIAMHTALVDEDAATSMEQAGIDVAMMDVIGAQETITQVYHLKRTVDDFEKTLALLVNTKMKVVPHIVIGLHYGRLLGERRALEMLQRYTPDAVVLVVVMPQYANMKRPFTTPESSDVGRFFMHARESLPDIPVMLGCARPAGLPKMEIDSYAVMAGLDGIAHPAEGVVEFAARLGRIVQVSPSCCSVSIGDTLGDALGDEESKNFLQLNLEEILSHEQRRRSVFKNVKIGIA
ncbi:MAG: radical SAM protein [Gammaproteobacteria bacterium]|nr:radical SAM protein [Gammaproteobacteria bacterium]